MNIPNIKYQIDDKLVKKILGNKNNAISLLKSLATQVAIPELIEMKKTELEKESIRLVVKYWDYNLCKNIIRELFKTTKKYHEGSNSAQAINLLIKEWKDLELGDITWPFSQGQFDAFVQGLNSQTISRTQKDIKVQDSALRYRRLKELNTARNDYLETLIFEKNEKILPTLSHNKGVDFFVDGISFDQKVSRSVTKQFMADKGEGWKNITIANPVEVARYLYTHQDEGRFGAEPRLFVVYLDEDISVLDLKSKIDEIDITQPQDVVFDYKHANSDIRNYRTQCYVILLSN